MKFNYLLALILLLLIKTGYSQQNVGIGILNPNANALLHLDDTNKGLLISVRQTTFLLPIKATKGKTNDIID